ncbi:MAG: endonuclease/exonuclease/phosphatase family protein [Parabacteroides gordonii]|nr:endonuclease/exonuclease/phosphatase family protein [Parabacteroides gordonii]
MKTLKALGLLLLLSLLPFKGISQEKAANTIKVISYNIWNGFEKDAARQARFTEWMNAQQPDIVALEELVGINEKDLAALAASYGHPYVAIVKEEGYPVGLTSRQPIKVVKKQVEGFWHGMLHAQTYGLDIIVTHLSPFEWKYRLKEAEAITHYIRENKLESCMVMGDFNAYSPFDADEVETHTQLK